MMVMVGCAVVRVVPSNRRHHRVGVAGHRRRRVAHQSIRYRCLATAQIVVEVLAKHTGHTVQGDGVHARVEETYNMESNKKRDKVRDCNVKINKIREKQLIKHFDCGRF